MTSTDRLVAGVIGALSAPPARLYEMNAAFGVVIVCVAFAATMEVMMTTTVAMRMTPGREKFCIRIVVAFILFGFLLCGLFWAAFNFPSCRLRQGYGVPRGSHFWPFSHVLQEIREKVKPKSHNPESPNEVPKTR